MAPGLHCIDTDWVVSLSKIARVDIAGCAALRHWRCRRACALAAFFVCRTDEVNYFSLMQPSWALSEVRSCFQSFSSCLLCACLCLCRHVFNRLCLIFVEACPAASSCHARKCAYLPCLQGIYSYTAAGFRPARSSRGVGPAIRLRNCAFYGLCHARPISS